MVVFTSLVSFAQEQDPPTNCVPMLTLSEFASNPSVTLTFAYKEVDANGVIVSVYDYSCHGIHYPKRCRKSGEFVVRGKANLVTWAVS